MRTQHGAGPTERVTRDNCSGCRNAVVSHCAAESDFFSGWFGTVCQMFALGALVGFGCLIFCGDRATAAALAVLFVSAAVVQSGEERRVKVSIDRDPEGKPRRFVLSVGRESVRVEPGNTWIQTDHFKWVTRGLMDAPQSFRVFPDGGVEINGEKIGLTDPDACNRFETELNKRFAAVATEHKPAATKQAAAPTRPVSDKARFRVKLDHLGHITVECFRGEEKVETGLRGLSGLVENGLMLKPQTMHVHPLQQWIELDGVRFECNEAGARALEIALNEHYAPKLASHQAAIEIRENPAAATGFDIRFFITRAGAKFEVKGHLCQEYLDLLQDQSRCDLLKPGIVIKLTPPNLIIRRKRPDGGEEPIPEFPDIQYRKITARQLEQILNHPLIRRGGTAISDDTETAEVPMEFISLRICRDPATRPFLCLECVPAHGENPVRRALTHHNVADLQTAGVFRTNFEVSLSLDNQILTILNKETGKEERFQVGGNSSEDDLAKAGAALTVALKPPSARPAKPATAPPDTGAPVASQSVLVQTGEPVSNGHTKTAAQVPIKEVPKRPTEPASVIAAESENRRSGPPAVPCGPATVSTEPKISTKPAVSAADVAKAEVSMSEHVVSEHPMAKLFRGVNPVQVNVRVFEKLAAWFGVDVEEVHLSLPMVFENRRFEVINFSGIPLETVLDLRSQDFYGFYLTHIHSDEIELVYSCRGRRLEWGVKKCLALPGLGSEPLEFKGSALLGMGQNKDRRFAFVVTPEYKSWIAPHAKAFEEVCVQFVTVPELLAAPDQYDLIWPEQDQSPT